MTSVISIITGNLVWILVGIVVILLAIIGRYADKTNFGEGKKIVKVKKKKGKRDIIEELEVQSNEEPVQEQKEKNSNPTEEIDIIAEMQNNTRDNFNSDANEEQKEADELKIDDNIVESEEIKEEKKKESEEMSSDEFMKSDDLDILLPKKDIVTGDFLQEVEDMNLDFKKKDLFSDIPDLDDVDLPTIKKKKTKTDIWG